MKSPAFILIESQALLFDMVHHSGIEQFTLRPVKHVLGYCDEPYRIAAHVISFKYTSATSLFEIRSSFALRFSLFYFVRNINILILFYSFHTIVNDSFMPFAGFVRFCLDTHVFIRYAPKSGCLCHKPRYVM